MKIALNDYYHLIEDNLVSRDILYKLSRRTKNITLKNFFFDRAHARDEFSSDLKDVLKYNFKMENFRSLFSKMVFNRKYRKYLLRTLFNRNEQNLLNVYLDVLETDILTYKRLIEHTGKPLDVYEVLMSHYKLLKNINEQYINKALPVYSAA